jgi:hypothetical protein
MTAARRQEAALANAVNAHNRNALAALTQDNFHVDLSYGSVVHGVRSDLTRQEWIDRMTARQIVSYSVAITSVRPAGPQAVDVALNEHLTLRTNSRCCTVTTLQSVDMWIKGGDAWKLATRVSHAGQQP